MQNSLKKPGDKKVRRPRRAISDAEEEEIIERLKEGKKFSEVATMFDRDVTVIKRLARLHAEELEKAIDLRMSGTGIVEKQNEFCKYLESNKRQEVLCEAIERIRDMMYDSALTAKDMRDLMVSLGIVIDKFAVENGKADNSALQALQAVFSKMEQNVEVKVYAASGAPGETSQVHNVQTEEDEYIVRKLEVEQVNSGGPEVA